MIYTTFYNCYLGKILLASDGKNLTGLWFEGQKHYPKLINTLIEDDLEIFIKVKNWLNKYLNGENPSVKGIHVKLTGTEFQQKVWKELKNIPYGKIVTYSDIANKLGIKSYRAVGNAIGMNPVSIIIPCHRVIGKNGKLTGYAAGLDKKIKLLQTENIL